MPEELLPSGMRALSARKPPNKPLPRAIGQNTELREGATVGSDRLIRSDFESKDFSKLDAPALPLVLREPRWQLVYTNGLPKAMRAILTGQYSAQAGRPAVHLGGYQGNRIPSPYLGGALLPEMSLQSWVIAYPQVQGRAAAVTVEKGAYASAETSWQVDFPSPTAFAIPLGFTCDLMEWWFAVNSASPEGMVLSKDDPARIAFSYL